MSKPSQPTLFFFFGFNTVRLW